jgi:hypothetical protein
VKVASFQFNSHCLWLALFVCRCRCSVAAIDRAGRGNLVDQAQKLRQLGVKASKSQPPALVDGAYESDEALSCVITANHFAQ